MKNIVHIITFFSLFLLITANSFAEEVKGVISKNASTHKANASDCFPGVRSYDLDINNVRARINTGGDMWFDKTASGGNAAEYEIPKGSGKTSLFSASLWIGGEDDNGQLRLAALRYSQRGNDYWPGPLTIDWTAQVDNATCYDYDKHFVMTRAEVEAFTGDMEDGNLDDPDNLTERIENWPGNGDPTKNQSFFLAPYVNVAGSEAYEPTLGDYPYYDFENSLCNAPDKTMEEVYYNGAISKNSVLADQVLKGDMTLWWVFNDKGNVHTETSGDPIGLEIRAQAFAFNTSDEINNMTFYSYEIINRSTYRLNNTYFSQWVDTDLGHADDDYVGCDVERGLGYCYNGRTTDGQGQSWAYEGNPPAVGIDFFQGPYMDADGLNNPKYDANGDQIVDESINGVNFKGGFNNDSLVDNERYGMRRFVYHNNSNSGVPEYMTDPETAPEYYNFLRGIWKDNTKMKYGGNAHTSSGGNGPECDFMFPGDSDPWGWGTGQVPTPGWPNADGDWWTEATAGNQPEDRRFMQSAGPFTLESGAVNYITVGIPWARSATGGPWASVELLRQVDDKCQALFENCFKVIDGPDAPDLTIRELDRELILYITNPEGSNNFNDIPEDYVEGDPTIVAPDSTDWDSLYRFEGYQIFQLSDESVSVSDLGDIEKAREIAQCDIENYDDVGNPIGKLINIELRPEGNVPVVKVDGKNTGILHSFRVFEDAFSEEPLVNHKKYYFIAIAYAYNEYKKYSDDALSQGPESGLDGQKKPFLAGRKAPIGPVRVITAIPHFTSPEANGTKINSSYGEGPQITRIEGQGNGGNALEMTQASIDQIMSGSPWKIEHPVYEKSGGPINVRVIDPLNVKDGDFVLKFKDVVVEPLINPDFEPHFIDSANWILEEYNNAGVLVNTYTSDQSIRIENEQLLLDLGLAISINQVYPVGDSLSKDNGYIESSIEFGDSLNRWLIGVPDVDGVFGAQNWIRSGTATDRDDVERNDYDLTFDASGGVDGDALDANEDFEKMIFRTWAPYRLASKYTDGPAWIELINQNRISNLASVDIIITSDKSKWTRCPVIEMQEDYQLSIGNAAKFEQRNSPSVDKEGNPDGTGDGMGWFPGYAINIETGERLNMAFGEDSWLMSENGNDMIWNPSSNSFGLLGETYFGGKHFVYVFGHNEILTGAGGYDALRSCPAYDEGAWLDMMFKHSNSQMNKYLYFNAMWVGIPLAVDGQELLPEDNDATIKLRVAKPYRKYYSTHEWGSTAPQNDNLPMYTFSTGDLATGLNETDVAKNYLETVRVVPNPYYSWSSYETNQLDNRVKITNLPENCTVSIYSINGTLIRQFKVDKSGVPNLRGPENDEPKTSIDWDLKNFAGIPIAGGIYIIHIDAKDLGETTIKWFGSLRPTDLNSF